MDTVQPGSMRTGNQRLRNRKQTSCVVCHVRKRKCDARTRLPCSNCVKHNITGRCYVAAHDTAKRAKLLEGGQQKPNSVRSAHDQLEDVLRRIESSAVIAGPSQASLCSLEHEQGVDIMQSPAAVSFATIVNDSSTYSAAGRLATSLYASGNLRSHLANGMPSDALAASLIADYLDYRDNLVECARELDGSIYEQYQNLRSSEDGDFSYSAASVIYMMFVLGIQHSEPSTYNRSCNGMAMFELKINYAGLSKAALSQSEASENPSLDQINAFLMAASFAKTEGRPDEGLRCISNAVRISQSMEMHHEHGRPWGPQDARRRYMWWVTYKGDRLLNFTFGRPYGIFDHHCDTKLPDKSWSQYTQLKLARILGEITDAYQCNKFPSYGTVFALDRKLEELESDVMSRNAGENPRARGLRNLEIIDCLWARCALHRMYLLAPPISDFIDSYMKSKNLCISLCIQILRVEEDSLKLYPRKFWAWYGFAYRILEAALTLCVAIIKEHCKLEHVEALDPWVLEARVLLDALARVNPLASASIQTLDYARQKYISNQVDHPETSSSDKRLSTREESSTSESSHQTPSQQADRSLTGISTLEDLNRTVGYEQSTGLHWNWHSNGKDGSPETIIKSHPTDNLGTLTDASNCTAETNSKLSSSAREHKRLDDLGLLQSDTMSDDYFTNHFISTKHNKLDNFTVGSDPLAYREFSHTWPSVFDFFVPISSEVAEKPTSTDFERLVSELLEEN